ncbi:MAG: hypothetical protein ACYSUI_19800 [Planctomycetota bacterium]
MRLRPNRQCLGPLPRVWYANGATAAMDPADLPPLTKAILATIADAGYPARSLSCANNLARWRAACCPEHR